MSHFAHVRIIKTVTMGWAGHVTYVEVRNVYSANICSLEVEGKRTFQAYVDDNTKTDLNEILFVYVNWCRLAQYRFE